MLGVLRQEHRRLPGRIAAADHHHFFIAQKFASMKEAL
jgi:hypothetical protein